jgi:5-methylcytosine-specific restriction endonuclease McrBC regulatory subunit McrC
MATFTITDNFFADVEESGKNGLFHDKKPIATAKIQLNLSIDTLKITGNLSILNLLGNGKIDNEDELVLSIEQSSNKWRARSGNFVGNIKYQNHDIYISSRFSDAFLKYMLNSVENVFLAENDMQCEKTAGTSDFILYYLFVQRLEKAFLMGLPKQYLRRQQRHVNIKGQVHIAGLIKKDMPYKGKISSEYRERGVDEALIAILNHALKVVYQKSKPIARNVDHVYNAIRQLNPPSFSRHHFQEALTSKALSNPLFSGYKSVLELAKLIIENDSISKSTSSAKSLSFLVNVAELFEIYIRKLLTRHFPDWQVSSPRLRVYEMTFFERYIIPDIVMIKGKDVIVFDTKYKSMSFKGKSQYDAGDLDRNDFFQIHTYLSYYQNHGYNVLGGGLLYPMKTDCSNCCADLFGKQNTLFVVDGVKIPYDFEKHSSGQKNKGENPNNNHANLEELLKNERAFIQRISHNFKILSNLS